MPSELTVIDDVRALLLETGNATLRRQGTKVNLVVNDRTVQWAVAVLVKQGWKREVIEQGLSDRPKHRRWIYLQQRMKAEVLEILAQHLEEAASGN